MLLILEPPYLDCTPLPRPPLPIGAFLVADLGGGIPVLAEALIARRESPWCPIVPVIRDPAISHARIAAFEPFPGAFAPLYPGDFREFPPIERVLAAVRRRPVPQLETLARYVQRRTGVPGTALLVAGCFSSGAGAVIGRTGSRRLAGFGPLTVRDWRGIGALARLLSGHPCPPSGSLERAALEAGLDPRTLRRWVRLTTDLAWPEIAVRPGWEWVIESALRKWGYLESRRPVEGWASSPAVETAPRPRPRAPGSIGHYRRYRSSHCKPSSSVRTA